LGGLKHFSYSKGGERDKRLLKTFINVTKSILTPHWTELKLLLAGWLKEKDAQTICLLL
jgi:hypothetical protein